MLTTLFIKNYALIEEISVEFDKGFNVITGETGAGKSIFIDALSLILGERANAEVIRSGSEKAIVEGTFSISGNSSVTELLQKNEIEVSQELLLRREISAKGQNRCFVNDSPVSLSVLKEIGDVVVDLHGQHEHQSLLRPDTHIDFLDNFGGYEKEFNEYKILYKKLVELSNKKHTLKEQENQLKEKKSLYEFQIKEIDEVSPKENEEVGLEAELKILENSEKLNALTQELYFLLYEAEHSVCSSLVQAEKKLIQLSEIDTHFSESAAEAKSIQIIANELSKFIQNYNARIEFNPKRLEEIRERLGTLSLLKKKYGGTIESLLEFRAELGEEFKFAENFEEELATLEKEISFVRIETGEKANILTNKRKEASKKLEKAILSSIAELGIPKAQFKTVIQQREIFSNVHTTTVEINGKLFIATFYGVDEVQFFISTNVGEELKPLAKVASGGEVSRIMLALKSALASSDKTPLLIFDEIDTGVSGRIGQAVGVSLKKLSNHHQVIAITHLPQIAALADVHFAVEKTEIHKKTSTHLRKLTTEERVQEVAKLMSGAEVTDAGLKSAKELMGIR